MRPQRIVNTFSVVPPFRVHCMNTDCSTSLFFPDPLFLKTIEKSALTFIVDEKPCSHSTARSILTESVNGNCIGDKTNPSNTRGQHCESNATEPKYTKQTLNETRPMLQQNLDPIFHLKPFKIHLTRSDAYYGSSYTKEEIYTKI